ncbi:MAG: menaquinol-cytochrome c reductase cytochrome b/c subunit [Miltoncostaeaceae bacterium]|nr:menaquinol-cytochrome c reductase cytochrome b/c subunit [Miltoncostaeaceae bacterium]
MNRAQQEAYKQDYATAKAGGKPFFPYAVFKDILVASCFIGLVIVFAVAFPFGQGPPVDPTTTTYVPRPEWYFYFLFELLRIFKNQNALMPVIMGTFIIPNILMVLLFATPFIDRGQERRIQRRPIALAAGILVTVMLCWLTYLGATAPEGIAGGGTIPLTNLDAKAKAGLNTFLANGCTNCHMIKGSGAAGPGPNLTNEGSKPGHDAAWEIAHLKCPTCKSPGSIMPPFTNFTPQQYDELATLLTGLGTKYK